jgi:hypothetical protein
MVEFNHSFTDGSSCRLIRRAEPLRQARAAAAYSTNYDRVVVPSLLVVDFLKAFCSFVP